MNSVAKIFSCKMFPYLKSAKNGGDFIKIACKNIETGVYLGLMSIKENIEEVKSRIRKAVRQAGRDPEEIEIVAVTKTVAVESIEEAVASGIKIVGESRIQEAEEKFARIGTKVKWHLIGHLQTNKVKKALGIFDLIHSVDNLRLAEAINKEAQRIGKIQPILIQANSSFEMTKFGFEEEELKEAVARVSALPFLQVQGLMTIGPLGGNPEEARPCFGRLKRLFEEIKEEWPMKCLSMGMTNDFEVAIEEGANLVRIGRGIFGEREER